MLWQYPLYNLNSTNGSLACRLGAPANYVLFTGIYTHRQTSTL
jgi:hypothetical protein